MNRGSVRKFGEDAPGKEVGVHLGTVGRCLVRLLILFELAPPSHAISHSLPFGFRILFCFLSLFWLIVPGLLFCTGVLVIYPGTEYFCSYVADVQVSALSSLLLERTDVAYKVWYLVTRTRPSWPKMLHTSLSITAGP